MRGRDNLAKRICCTNPLASRIACSLAMKLWLLLLCSVALARAQSTSNAQGNAAQEHALTMTSRLYLTLRNIAFPDHKLTDDTNVDSRFLMMMPGKVLNYLDYFPGPEYTNFIQNPNAETPETVVPPRVMERWFDLADNIPNFNPMNAQDTGKSLANIYRSILHESKLLGLESKTASEKAIMKEATDYLNKMVPDPENTSVTVPRLTLYERYRDLYNDRKLEMEDMVDQKRRSVGYIDYELWFQRHYPSLQSKVESAYTRWLIFGEKETVELYITYMDTGSAGKQLEEARMALRAAGVTSLDRTRTIYPVSFEPSNWYIYLLPEEQVPSQDQLRLMQGKLQSKINAIERIINVLQTNPNITGIVQNLQRAFKASENSSLNNVTTFMNAQIGCLRSLNSETPCQDQSYEDKRRYAISAMFEAAQTFTTYQFGSYYSKPQDFVNYLQRERSSLEAQMRRVETLLGSSSPYLGGLLDDSQLAVSNLSLATRDQQWLQFEYDSESTFVDEQSERTMTSIQASASFRFFFFGGSARYSYNKNTADYSRKMAKSNLRVKGELLRVNIKRPWFKPELFEIPDITFKESHDGINSFVSPGQEFTESEFYNEVSDDQTQYKLPEYTTGFLLARKVEMEFSGLDSETVTSTMSRMSHFGGSGGFLFFRASVSVTKTKQTSHVQVKRTANGMKINIPGAQIIGYYTQVLPRFPVNQ